MLENLAPMAVFAKVAETASFTAAARDLGLSKSVVSKYVAKLENSLGARLINRTTRRLSLTEVGEAFYERCRRIVQEAEEAELAVTRLHAAPRGRLRVNLPMSFGLAHVAPLVPEFLSAYPEINLDYTLDDQVVDVIEDGYDVVIRITSMPDSSLFARKLAPMRTVTCASPDYWAANGKPTHPKDLGQHNCLVYSYLATRDEWQYEEASNPIAVKVSGCLRANNGDALTVAAVAGLGVTRMPTFIVGEQIKSGALVPVLEDFEPQGRGIYAVYPHNRHLSAKVRAFVDFLVTCFGEQPYWEPNPT